MRWLGTDSFDVAIGMRSKEQKWMEQKCNRSGCGAWNNDVVFLSTMFSRQLLVSVLSGLRGWRIRGIALSLVVVLALSVAGCTGASVPKEATVRARMAQPREAVTVVGQDSPAGRAAAMSRALFVSSSVVVVIAPGGNPDAQAVAAGTAKRWGVPMLLAAPDPAPRATTHPSSLPSPGKTSSSPARRGAAGAAVGAEIARLHAAIVATVGDVGGLDVGDARVAPIDQVLPQHRRVGGTSQGVCR